MQRKPGEAVPELAAVGTGKDLSKSIVVITQRCFCNFCKITGHREKVCREKAQQSRSSVKSIRLLEVNSITDR